MDKIFVLKRIGFCPLHAYKLMKYPLDLLKPNTKTQNIFCCVNESLTTFLYTLTGGTRKQREKKKFSLLNCISMYKSRMLLKKISFCFLVPPVKVYKKVIKFSIA